MTLLDLQAEAYSPDSTDDALAGLVRISHRQLGAPGDFGYGTPEGDALSNLYQVYNDYVTTKTAAEVNPS